MSIAAHNYAAAARIAMSPREVEASALLKSAARLQATATQNDGPGLTEALLHNRRLWIVIAASVDDPASHLPPDLKAQVLTLANFIFNHTLAIESAPTIANVGCLVTINRELAAGLRTGG